MSIRLRFIQATLAALMVVAAGPSYAVEFPKTSDVGAPARTPSFGTRGEICLDPRIQPSLTSLLPQNAIATAFGTDADIPLSLWFYVPQTGAESVELTVFDSLGNEVYQKALDVPDNPGTIQITLPTYQDDGITPMFASGDLYYWDFALVCDPSDRSDDVLLDGGIQRLDASSDFLAQLEAATGDRLAQAELYAQAGAWQETITLAANMRPQNPETWTELLLSVGLDLVVAEPIVGQSESITEPSVTPAAPQASSGENAETGLQQLLEGINNSADE